jgi:hypothetical protein
MYDHIAIVHQHPMGILKSFDAQRPGAEFFERFFNLAGYCLGLCRVFG